MSGNNEGGKPMDDPGPAPRDLPAQAPDDDADRGLSGDLSTVTDDEWQLAHRRLMADLGDQVPAEQVAYRWAPGEEPGDVADVAVGLPGPGEVPLAGEFDAEGPDVRLLGGGFRG